MDKFTTINGTRVFYRDQGEGDVVMVLHGWGSNIADWTKVHDELAERGFRVVAMDLPGFGQSDEPKKAWHLKDFSEFVHDFAKDLGIGYFAIAGHSFGGRIGVDYALRWPQQLSALILISAAAVVRYPRIKTSLFLWLMILVDWIFFDPLFKKQKAYVKKLWHNHVGQEHYYNTSMKMNRTLKSSFKEDLRPYFPKITTPTLLLWGDKDTATPISDAFILHRGIPLTHLHVLPDLPHALQFKAPVEIAKNIAYFLTNNPIE